MHQDIDRSTRFEAAARANEASSESLGMIPVKPRHDTDCTATFSYDANGNMTSGAGRTITPTSFNMAGSIVQGTVADCFTYDSEHNRIEMDARSSSCTGTLNTSTIYLNDPASGAMSEAAISGETTTWKDYIAADNGLVAVRFCTGASPCTTGASFDYVVTDHLGSTSVLTNGSGSVSERDSYDAWGLRRNPNGSDASTCNSISSALTRGFTGQEHIDATCAINFNARIYDPTIGRFMSADSFVPDPLNGQAFNRYSYVLGNPLAFTDPTGHDCSDPQQQWSGGCQSINYDATSYSPPVPNGCGGPCPDGPDPAAGGLYRNPGFSGFGSGGGGTASGGGGGGAGGGGNGGNDDGSSIETVVVISPPRPKPQIQPIQASFSFNFYPLFDTNGRCVPALIKAGNWLRAKSQWVGQKSLGVEIAGLGMMAVATPFAPATADADEIPGAGVTYAGAFGVTLGGVGDMLGGGLQWAGGASWQHFAAPAVEFAAGYAIGNRFGGATNQTGKVVIGANTDIWGSIIAGDSQPASCH